MPKQYHKPELVEYGRIGELTLGAGGTEPDYQFSGGTLNLINNSCTAGAPATACLLPASS
jgi:hypothetical protein